MKELCSCSSHKYVCEIYGRKKMSKVDDVTPDMFLKKDKKIKRRECGLSKDTMELYYQGISLYF